MKNKTEMTVTLAAVVACLGTALGVTSTDLHAATSATQHKEIPRALQSKRDNAVNQNKKRPEAIYMKYSHISPVKQGKKHPAVNQKQKKRSGGG